MRPHSSDQPVSAEQFARVVAERDRLEAQVRKLLAEREQQGKLIAWLRTELERLQDKDNPPREKVDPASVQLVFAEMFEDIFGKLGFDVPCPPTVPKPPAQPPARDRSGRKKKGQDQPQGRKHGRRDLEAAPYCHLPTETVVLEPEPLPAGALHLSTDLTYRLGYRRGGYIRIKIVRPAYAVKKAQAEAPVSTKVTHIDAEGQQVGQATDPPVAPSSGGDGTPGDDRGSPGSTPGSTVHAGGRNDATDVAAAHGTEPNDGEAQEAGESKVTGAPAEGVPRAISAVPPEQREEFLRDLFDRSMLMAPMPVQLIPKGLASPELIAHVLYGKFRLHLPFNRQERDTAQLGIPLSRSTMCEWQAAAHEYCKFIVADMERDAQRTADIILTDATGVLVQAEGKCKQGHFFIYLADKKHAILRYNAIHSHEEPEKALEGFRGVVMSDASAIFNALFGEEDGPEEANCWSHARRYFVKAVTSEHREEALMGVGFANQLFRWEKEWKKHPPSKKLELRQKYTRPLLERMWQWLCDQLGREDVKEGSRLRKALNYLDNQWEGLTLFLKDGSVPLHNNDSERHLRHVAVGRNNWIFLFRDDTGPSTATFITLLLSCQLHGLDGEQYLRDVLRVIPHWPKGRMLELSPAYWVETRARLSEMELAMPLGPLTIPPRVAPSPAVAATTGG